jgi:hypothetical protein
MALAHPGSPAGVCRFRHYVNLGRCAAKLARLVRGFRLVPMLAVLERKGLIGA